VGADRFVLFGAFRAGWPIRCQAGPTVGQDLPASLARNFAGARGPVQEPVPSSMCPRDLLGLALRRTQGKVMLSMSASVPPK
jgi:hypothetical protein